MPIMSPLLDDLTYDRIVAELLRRIPVYSPEWTDYNDSDPGITLIQLFAYLAEMVGYRLNQVPQKSEAALLQLLGATVSPAKAATTRLALTLTDPTKLTAYTLAKGASVKASTGMPPPAFQADTDLLVVPIEPVVLATTKYGELWNSWDSERTSNTSKDSDYLTVLWDDQSLKLQDMPLKPVPLNAPDTQRYLWLGVSFNSDPSAGAIGAKVQLTIQYDADDEPAPAGRARSGAAAPAARQSAPIDWVWYYDAPTDGMVQLPGRIDDTTNRLANSGTLTFAVPPGMGAIPSALFQPLWPAPSPSPNPGAAYALNLQNEMTAAGVSTPTTLANTQTWVQDYTTALKKAMQDTIGAAGPASPPALANPLDPKFYKTMGWFRIELQAAPAPPLSTFKLRIVTFNAVGATNATTVTNEIVGVADGTPGQTYQLATGNIRLETLSLAVQEAPAANNASLVPWTTVASLDSYGPFDSVFVLDAETGSITFGDGVNGRIPPLVPQGGNIIALSYIWGGGSSGNVAVGAVSVLNSSAPGIAAAINYVAATGGSDTETQDQAATRARKMLSSGSRAVSSDDFAWLATQTPDVQVARVQVVPLRKPVDPMLPVAAANAAVRSRQQQQPQPPQQPVAIQTGLADSDTPGVVSVVVVPKESGPEPTPSPAFLNAVAQNLDAQRLITTEVHTVPPQYVRLYNVRVSVTGRPGYTLAALQSSVSGQLAGYLHVLTGGENGTGFAFGGELHVADIIAKVYRADGVARVDSVTADFLRTRSNASGSLALTPTPASTNQFNSLSLAPDETMSFDAASFILSTVT
jgi:hypothetical protein